MKKLLFLLILFMPGISKLYGKIEAKGWISVFCSMSNNKQNEVKVSWIADSYIAAKTFCIYCSIDDGEYLLLTPDTKNTEMTYFVPKGHTYKFAVTARNSLGQKYGTDFSCNTTYNNK